MAKIEKYEMCQKMKGTMKTIGAKEMRAKQNLRFQRLNRKKKQIYRATSLVQNQKWQQH